MNRREAVQGIVASAALAGLARSLAAQPIAPPRTALGLVTYCCRFRTRMLAGAEPSVDLSVPSRFLEHCRSLGAGGMQHRLGVMKKKDALALRRQAEQHSQYIEAIISVPEDEAAVERFDAEMRTAAAVGAAAVRTTIIPGRRYEYFDSLEMFREFASRGERALQLAAPVAEKYRLPLAVENHKDQRNAERVALLERISSEFVGACVDTGNSFALLEDPVETATALAPWAHSVHLKDQAVQMVDDGFLLADIPLGQGFIDLKRIVPLLKRQRPGIHFSLELITRDPLRVPVLGDKYWQTFPELPARDLARTFKTVRDHASDRLQYPSRLDARAQVALEDANVRASLDYAREELKL